MRVMIVDDERLALQSMMKHLKELGAFNITGVFQNPREAMDWVMRDAVDIAFLDIEMPEMSGMVLAERLMEIRPSIEIVFVTAYSHYAIDAFEINALDYLMKPVQRSRLEKTVRRLQERTHVEREAKKPEPQAMLGCLLNLHYRNDAQDIQTFQWRTTKAQELFAYLIHYRGHTVHKENILEWIWPEYELEKSTAHLHTTIYQIRRVIKQLGLDIQVKYQDEGYRLEQGSVLIDVEVWEQGIRSAPPVAPETLQHHHALLDLYRGDYLGDHRYIWAESERERLSMMWFVHAKQVVDCHMQLGQYTEAMLLLQQLQERYPYVEDIYFGMMKIHAMHGNLGEVKRQYERLTWILQQELGVGPSEALHTWYTQHFN